MSIDTGSRSEYDLIHYQARKALAGSACEHCGTAERIQAALWPGTDPSRLWIDPTTGCRYSLYLSDYHPLCQPCHFRMDAEARGTCASGHERTPENTSYRPDGSRRCLICHREQERERKADPAARTRASEVNREWRHKNPMTPEQKARKVELQRARRAIARTAA